RRTNLSFSPSSLLTFTIGKPPAAPPTPVDHRLRLESPLLYFSPLIVFLHVRPPRTSINASQTINQTPPPSIPTTVHPHPETRFPSSSQPFLPAGKTQTTSHPSPSFHFSAEHCLPRRQTSHHHPLVHPISDYPLLSQMPKNLPHTAASPRFRPPEHHQ
ncbi:hypothetical protein HAX54_039008, partial [Datura stramonium]|nr:hypothetical protein [Datura stramonium]